MNKHTTTELIEQARAFLQPRKQGNTTGDVACALLSDKDNLNFGVRKGCAIWVGFVHFQSVF